ncbi:hypothetical protein AA15669_1723 [Saccharibacter floricola DSM 15669]|uniref:Uncharacterized protein n=1 Tax=Saccharibacter floricola DSM 15669 TaxID=1123227 RepID=A0ABQ0P0Y6_9PROT|nr:hypothetical protein AA15669_1723 [Saccharibacter floricola DSM 15669]
MRWECPTVFDDFRALKRDHVAYRMEDIKRQAQRGDPNYHRKSNGKTNPIQKAFKTFLKSRVKTKKKKERKDQHA